jgi:hypothetical protein
MNESANQPDQRGTFLAAVFTLLGTSFVLFFLFLSCGGLAVYVIGVTAGLALFGLIHYLLWGHTFSQEAAGEREDDENRQAADDIPDREEAKEWTEEERSWYRRF